MTTLPCNTVNCLLLIDHCLLLTVGSCHYASGYRLRLNDSPVKPQIHKSTTFFRFNNSTIQQFPDSTVPQFQPPSNQPNHRLVNCTTPQLPKYTTPPRLNISTIKQFNNSNVCIKNPSNYFITPHFTRYLHPLKCLPYDY